MQLDQKWKRIFLFITFIALPSPSFAQEAGAGNPNSYFDLGLKTGSFLPYGIEGVRELLPIWGVRLGHSVSPTLALEYDLDIAHAKGVSYYLAYFSLRHDFVVGDALPLFVLIGVDAHYYKRKSTIGSVTGTVTDFDYRLSTGWHTGFGTETLIYGDLYFRGDVRMGFSPGRQLSANLGITYRF